MHIEVGNHAGRDEFGLNEVAGQFDALRLRQFARQGEFDLAGELGVLAQLAGFDIVPQPFAVGKMVGGAVRQHDLGMDDAAFIGEVVAAVEAFVAQP
ncbi:hypothetical protein J3R73_000217 [Labrys monachus]|uniref:Uncharacterized protein n=1 Tax=Labrys monachus TaxID=217067 RepID=A0ABU0F775_9HYPH|nr:hypothetical protein [Labrys monachus]